MTGTDLLSGAPETAIGRGICPGCRKVAVEIVRVPDGCPLADVGARVECSRRRPS